MMGVVVWGGLDVVVWLRLCGCVAVVVVVRLCVAGCVAVVCVVVWLWLCGMVCYCRSCCCCCCCWAVMVVVGVVQRSGRASLVSEL
jgi:hypothetical protein